MSPVKPSLVKANKNHEQKDRIRKLRTSLNNKKGTHNINKITYNKTNVNQETVK